MSSGELKWVQVSQVNPSESKWVQVSLSESKWVQVSPSECKWVSPSESKWIQVSPSESKWIQVNPSKSKWIPVNPSEALPLPPILLSNFRWSYRWILINHQLWNYLRGDIHGRCQWDAARHDTASDWHACFVTLVTPSPPVNQPFQHLGIHK